MKERITQHTSTMTASLSRVDRGPAVVEGWQKTDEGYRMPDGWTLYNAPRPLYGTVTWLGDFLTGRHYAAISPDDPDAALWVEFNEKQQAVIVRYVPLEKLAEIGRQFFMEREIYRRAIHEWSGDAERLQAMFVHRAYELFEYGRVNLRPDGSFTIREESGPVLSITTEIPS